MRFTLQQLYKPAVGKSRYRTVVGIKNSLGKWQVGESGRAGLRYSKTLQSLAEDVRYRVNVEARAVDQDGVVVTKTAKRVVPCIQPLFTPTLSITKVVDAVDPATGTHTITATVRNAGRLVSDASVVTVNTLPAAGAAQVGQAVTTDGIPGLASIDVPVALTACKTRVRVSVSTLGPDGATPVAFPVAAPVTVVCGGTATGAKAPAGAGLPLE